MAIKAGAKPTGLATLPPKPVAQPPQGGQEAAPASKSALTPEQFLRGSEGAVAPSMEAAPIEAVEPVQRLTLEIPLSLHIKIKMGCAERHTKMKQEVLALLESHYRPKP